MKLRIMSFITLLVLVLSVSALALPAKKGAGKDANRPDQARAEKKSNQPEQGQALRELGLTDAQTQQIRSIVEKYRASVREVKESNASQEDKKARIATLRSKAEVAIEGVLTPEQREKVKQKRLMNRLLNPTNQMNEGTMRAFEQLNLTEDQKARIKTLQDALKVKVQEIRANTSLTDAQKNTQIAELRKQTRENILNILTPEQKQKLQEMRNKKPQPNQQQKQHPTR